MVDGLQVEAGAAPSVQSSVQHEIPISACRSTTNNTMEHIHCTLTNRLEYSQGLCGVSMDCMELEGKLDIEMSREVSCERP